MFQSGFHRLGFFYAVASVIVWFFAFRSWWGTLAAAILCIPVGFFFSLLPAMVVGMMRQGRRIHDSIPTWLSLVGGAGIAVYAVVAHDGITAALIALTGVGFVVAGIGLIYMRSNAMRYRAAMGEASADDVEFLQQIDRS